MRNNRKGKLADGIRQKKDHICKELRIGYANWDDLDFCKQIQSNQKRSAEGGRRLTSRCT